MAYVRQVFLKIILTFVVSVSRCMCVLLSACAYEVAIYIEDPCSAGF